MTTDDTARGELRKCTQVAVDFALRTMFAEQLKGSDLAKGDTGYYDDADPETQSSFVQREFARAYELIVAYQAEQHAPWPLLQLCDRVYRAIMLLPRRTEDPATLEELVCPEGFDIVTPIRELAAFRQAVHEALKVETDVDALKRLRELGQVNIGSSPPPPETLAEALLQTLPFKGLNTDPGR